MASTVTLQFEPSEAIKKALASVQQLEAVESIELGEGTLTAKVKLKDGFEINVSLSNTENG